MNRSDMTGVHEGGSLQQTSWCEGRVFIAAVIYWNIIGMCDCRTDQRIGASKAIHRQLVMQVKKNRCYSDEVEYRISKKGTVSVDETERAGSSHPS